MALRHPNAKTPGQLIKALLDDLGWTQHVMGVVLGIGQTTVSKIVNDKRPIDASMALLLGEVFEEDPGRFLSLQSNYDLAQARLFVQVDPQRQTRAMIFSTLPVAEMIKRRWLNVETIRDVPGIEQELAKFFGVSSIDEIEEILPHAAKKTSV